MHSRPNLAVFWIGEADGAIPNGTRIVRTAEMLDGPHVEGDEGVVVSSHGPIPAPEDSEKEYGYFIEWDDMPGVPVFTRGRKVRAKT